jgi:hypothetical protein
VDNAHHVVTAHLTTGGAVAEDTKLFELVEKHQQNTRWAATLGPFSLLWN